MKKLLLFLFISLLVNDMNAQNRDITSNFGIEGDVSIILIDNEITVFEDQTNSILKFEIVNNNDFPIYIPHPELKSGTVPQYFNLWNKSMECIFEDTEMVTRNASEFVFVPANSSKAFELHNHFVDMSCVGLSKEENVFLVYRAFEQDHIDKFFAMQLMKKDRDGRDIIEYFLTSKLKSESIKIIYN